MVRRRIVFWFVIPILLLPSLFTHLALWRIEAEAGLHVSKKPFLTFSPGTIDLSRSEIMWKDRLETNSGSLTLRYPALGVFQGRFPVTIEARDLAVTFSPELAKMAGHDKLVFSEASARVIVSASREVEIEFLNAKSDTIEFHLGSRS